METLTKNNLCPKCGGKVVYQTGDNFDTEKGFCRECLKGIGIMVSNAKQEKKEWDKRKRI